MDNTLPAIDFKRNKTLYVWLLFASLVGLFASVMLTLDKISFWEQTAKGETPVLGCAISPLVGCGPVINTAQASIFGDIPNPVLGIIAFAMLLMFSLILILGGEIPKWFWGVLQVGVIFGIAMVTYLQYQSIYNLHVLCPYCMVVWAVTIPTFWLITGHNLLSWWPKSRLSKIFYHWIGLWVALHVIVLLSSIWITFGSTLFA